MKPEFALSLSFDGIRLLHRAAGGWREVGAVDVSSADLASDLAALRKKAGKVKTKRVRSKLILPEGQIKYLTIDTGDVDDAARREAARVALDGATPYAVDALAFDISAEGPKTHVAAVARETLAEAEAFAIEHKFNPVSFVAAPEDGGFLGEPFFGQTQHADELLRNGASVEPDGIRVVVVSHPDPEEAEDAPPTPNADAGSAEAVAEDTAATPDAQAETAPETPPAPTAAPEPEGDSTAEQAVAPDADVPDADVPDADVPPTDTPPQSADAKADEAPAEEAETDADATVETDMDQPVTAAAQDDALTDTVPKAAATAALDHDVEDSDAPKDAEDTPASPEDADVSPLMGFATRRRANGTDTEKPAPPAALGGVTREPPPPRPTARLSVADPEAETPKPPPPLLSPQQAAAQSLRAAPPIEDLPPPRVEAPAPDAAADKPKSGGFLSRRKPKRVPPAPPSAPSDRAATRAVARKAEAIPSPTDAEAQRMTVFGARTDVQVGGKPRFLGLVLTAILLVFLAGVAAWASVFLDDGLAKLFPKRERTLASTLPADAERALAEDVGATVELEPTENSGDELIVASLNEGLSDGLTPEDAAVLDALRDPQPDPAVQQDLDEAALEARYAVTGIWPKAPQIPPEPTGLIALEDLYVTGIDPVSPALDAIALPAPSSFQTDVAFPDVSSPPAPGTTFALDSNGRIVPTEEGALSPDGFTVFLGRPALVPPNIQRDTTEPEPETDAPDARILADQRPRARPDDLVEQNERATLGGLSRSELALLRPRLRPAAPQEVAAAQVIDALEAPADADTVAEDAQTISPLATAQSARPQTRPRNFDRIVARATRAAPAPQRVAAVAPRTVTPSIPSSASVTREATVRNAINLSRVNLIGVYGTPSNRRALVRLKSGRYQKVKVGDRFDGGRVSAIGDSELRYRKGNRNLVLKMPN